MNDEKPLSQRMKEQLSGPRHSVDQLLDARKFIPEVEALEAQVKRLTDANQNLRDESWTLTGQVETQVLTIDDLKERLVKAQEQLKQCGICDMNDNICSNCLRKALEGDQ